MFKLEQRHVYLVLIYRIYLVFFINAWEKAHVKKQPIVLQEILDKIEKP